MRRVVGSSAESLLPFVQEAVEPGAVVITDGLQSYRLLQQTVTLDPVPYRAIAQGVRGPKKGRHHNRLGLLE